MDKKYSKDQILEMYLNAVSYGGSNIGVEAAAESYFGKKAKELNLAQSAFLAGIPQSPSVYNPFTGQKHYIARSKQVLDSMVSNGYITQRQEDKAFDDIKHFQFSNKNTAIKAPHFVMFIKQYLVDELHFTENMIENGGYQITTTLDYEIQKKAEEIVKTEIEKLKGYNVF